MDDELHAVRQRTVSDQRALRERIAPLLGLEGDGPRENAAVDLGQRHMHGDVAGAQAVGAGAPGRFGAGGEDDLQDRTVGGAERRFAADSAGSRQGEGRGVEDDAWRGLADEVAQQIGGHRLLEAGGVDRERVQPGRGERRDQRIDGGEVAALQHRAIEDDGGERPIRLPAAAQVVERRLRQARPIQAGAQQDCGLAPVGGTADERAGVEQQVPRVPGATLHAVLPEPMRIRSRKGGERRQLRVGLVVAGQDRQRDGAVAAEGAQLLDAVGPVAHAAEEAHDHELRVLHDVVEVFVDRQVVAEKQQVGEAEARRIGRQPGARLRQTGKLGVGRGDEDDVAGRLAEIDGLAAVGDRAGLGG